MKVFLLHEDRDFRPKSELRDAVFEAMVSGNLFALTSARRSLERVPSDTSAAQGADDDTLEQDLELTSLWNAMASGDQFVFETAKRVTLSSLGDPDAIAYRQRVLGDCLDQRETIRQLYALAIDALASQREVGPMWHGAGPDTILHRSVCLLRLFVVRLRQLRAIADKRCEDFHSDGFRRFFAAVQDELSDQYLETIERQLGELEFARGVLESAELGEGYKGRDYVVHRPPTEPSWRQRLPRLGHRRPEAYSFELHPRDEAGARYLQEPEGRGINHVADAVAQSAEHVQSFFTMLRLELGFYLGCLNLHAKLDGKREPTCFPTPLAAGKHTFAAHDIYDVCLTLHLDGRTVGNDVDAEGKSLIMITGANQGGKSTLLRAIGLAQLMMQSGMFVGARSLHAAVSRGVFTHYRRQEDPAMEGGKLDEELSRMSRIADRILPDAILLCNESFASTNEREGSEIARHVVEAMLARDIRVCFVTHMYDLAHSLHARDSDGALFLRAERGTNGRRTFKLREGEPLPTSHGRDSYRRVFGNSISAEGSRKSPADAPKTAP